MAHAFRFGVQTSEAESGEHWRDTARRVEDLGYSSLLMPDHFVHTKLAPMTAIAVAAEATSTLRIGTLVLGNDYKHPAVLAKEAATLDLLSDGRLELGIGAGWMKSDYDALGLTYDRPGVRVDRLAEAVQILKGAWGPGPFSFSGEHYSVTDYDGTPKPVQQPHPPLLIGGGAKRVLSLAGREADIVGINPNLREGVMSSAAMKTWLATDTKQQVDWVREAAGDRSDDIELQVFYLAAVTDDRIGMAEAMTSSFGISAQEALDSQMTLVGTVGEIVETCHARREEYGFTYIVVGETEMDSFAPVVAQLAGT